MIYLREITQADLEEINLWRQDHLLSDFLFGPRRHTNIETDHAWFQNYMKCRENNSRLMICLSGDGMPIGRADILHIDPINRSAQFQILIANPIHRSKGYGRLATLQSLRHCFFDRNLHRVSLSVLSDNDQAIRLYRSCYFLEEGISRDSAFKNGRYVDVIHMAVLAHEFAKKYTGTFPMAQA
jgi:RimJ/RimL family protein N-acetyltransferase